MKTPLCLAVSFPALATVAMAQTPSPHDEFLENQSVPEVILFVVDGIDGPAYLNARIRLLPPV